MNDTNELISRQAAIDRINKQREHLQQDIYPQDKIGDAAYRICAEFIERLPSAQRTGRWKVSDLPKGKMKYCSECGFGQYIADERQYGYCPNCGAKMEVEE